jgi:phospholipid transport system substrate-binding protein
MNRRCLLLSLLTLFTATLQADDAMEADAQLRAVVEQVLVIATKAGSNAELIRKVRPTLQQHVSFTTMTRRAVGPGWKQFSADQQEQSTDLITTLVIRTYAGKMTPGEKPEVQFKKATSPSANRVDVPTTLVYKGSTYGVVYRLEKQSGWQITDVVIEGVSMIANYRTQLDAKFKQGGAAAVVQSLEQSVSR